MGVAQRRARQVMAAVFLLYATIASVGLADDADRLQFTVASGIETRRVLYQLDNSGSVVSLSPDGKRYLLMLVRGDLQRNGNWIEFVSGRTESLDAASQTQKVTRLFTRSYALNPLRYQPPVWLADSRRVAFLWSDDDSPYQVVTLDLETSQLSELTHHSTDITGFSLSARGDSLTFLAKVPHQDAPDRYRQMIRNGFAVSEDTYTVLSLLKGYPDDTAQGWYDRDLFVSVHSAPPQRVPVQLSTPQQIVPALSPDGRWTVFSAPALDVPPQWNDYADSTVQSQLAEVRKQRQRRSGQPDASALGQLRLIDMRHGTVSVLMDAPSWIFSPIEWSPDSQSIIIGPTCVPVTASTSCALFAEVTVPGGRVRRLPVPDDLARSLSSFGWNNTREVVLQGRSSDVQGFALRRRGHGWVAVAPAAAAPTTTPETAAVAIRLRQDLNDPPKLVAIDAGGAERVIFDVNAGLFETFALGEVEIVHWRDQENRAWTGRLYLPASYRAGERVPLAISTVPRIAALPSQFSTSGVEVAVSAVAIAQPLASRGIAVLTMGQPDLPTETHGGTPREPEIVLAGYESAVNHLVASGLVDAQRVGLVGYSRSGYYVQYAITHSTFRFAAAISADNVDQSYLQSTLVGNEMTWPEADRMNGAAPFAEGLKHWLERAPGFNAEKVDAPLRMELNSGGLANIVSQWELFSRLRRLRKPVELYLIPEIDKGEHGLENPKQQLASLEGAVDWMDFWLTASEHADPRKHEQYLRWRRLRELRDASRGVDGS